METVKNLLHNLTAKNDENVNTTGTGHTPGEGSHFHFAGAKDTTSTNPLTGTSATTSNTANTSDLSGTTGTGYATHKPFSGEGTHLQSSTNTGATSGLPAQHDSGVTGTTQGTHVPGEWVDDSSNVGTSQVPSSNTTSGSNVGHNVALPGEAGAIGGGVGEHSQTQRDLPIRSSENTSSSAIAHPNTSQLQSDSAYASTTGTSGIGSSDPAHTSTTGTSGLGSSDPAYTSETGTSGVGSSTTQGSSHLGRDAAIGGAGLGAAGLAAHEHNKHNEREFPLSSTSGTSHATTQPSSTGYTGATSQLSSTGYTGPGTSGVSHHTGPTGSGLHASGPHSTDTANLLDPHVNKGSLPTEDSHHHDRITGGGAEEADQHHGARNAGLGAGALGAAGLAKHEHDKHESSTTGATSGLGQSSSTLPTSSSTTNPTSSTQIESDEALARRLQAEENARAGSTTTGATSGLGHSSSTNPAASTDHHYGRDAGVGAGALGAAGLAEHEHKKHETTPSTGLSSGTSAAQTSSTTSALPGPAPNTAGPHHSDLLNKLDPRVKANPDKTASGTSDGLSQIAAAGPVVGGVSGPAATYGAGHTQHEKFETEAQRAAVNNHKRELAEQNKDHHYGRDAAVAGAAGGAVYEAEKHHSSAKTDPYQSVSPPGSTTHPISGAGAGVISSRDPLKDHHYGTQPGATTTGVHPGTQSTQTGTEHHYGRDAAGVGAVGAGAYELNKYHDAKEVKKEHRAEEKEEKKEEKELRKEHKQEEKAIVKEEKEEKKEAKHEQKEEKKEQKAYEKEEKKEHKAAEKEAKREQKKEQKEAKHEQKEEKKAHKHGFLSFLHRDKSKKYSKEEEDEFDRQEKEHNSRNAALGAGAVGAGGVGAYEAKKHHTSHGTAQPTTSTTSGTTDNSGLKPTGMFSTTSGTQQQIAEKTAAQNASLGIGQHSTLPGGTGVHSEASTDQYGQPIGSNVTGSSTTDSGSHLGRDAALGGGAGLGAGALAAHEHNKSSTAGTEAGYPSSTAQQGEYPSTTSTSGTTGQSHLGRDAAVAGGVGGLASHEHAKHDSGYAHGIDQGKTTSNTPSTTGIYEGHQPSTGTTDASGLQRHESYDPYSTRNEQSVLSHEHETGTGVGSSGVLGSRVSDLSGRNRLHKDPPADHPAAQPQGSAHVPASGEQRQGLVQEGEEQLTKNTGVAYGHGSEGPTY